MANRRKVLVGMSGGVDSSLSANYGSLTEYLGANALRASIDARHRASSVDEYPEA